MKIGILGSGVVAQALGAGFIRHGHDVVIGTSSPAKLDEWLAQHGKARVAGFAEAADFGEMLVLAVKGTAAVAALHKTGTERLAGKVVIDTTNPIADAAPQNGVLQFFTGVNDSLLEQLQREFPAVKFVKAFNSVGNAFMVNPSFQGGPPTMFICGNDESARRVVQRIVEQFGWEVADMGSAASARAIEPLCMLWCIPGLQHNDWAHAFKFLKPA